MAEADVRLIRDGYAAWAEGRELDLTVLDPEIEWVLHGTPAGDVTYRGHDGVRRWFAEQDEAWKDQWWSVEDVRELPDGRLLALVTAHAVGRESGVAVELPLANIWTLRAGRAVRLEVYLDRDAALEAGVE